jgi:hypothetical protein
MRSLNQLYLCDEATATGCRRNDRVRSRSSPIPAIRRRRGVAPAASIGRTKVYTWRSSFDGDAVVRIGRQVNKITLRWACRCFRLPGVDDTPPVVPLSPADWARLQDALIAASFLAVDPMKDRFSAGSMEHSG